MTVCPVKTNEMSFSGTLAVTQIVSEALFPVPTWILRLTPAEPKITRPLKAVVSLMRLTSRRISWYSLESSVPS